ncbi:MAG: prepilin-type N-terminal cleavage/methylation domain-containing protein [Gemmatimonadota bacterium]
MRGFTLVEVVVALVLLEIGVLGVVGTFVIASRTMARAEVLERATLTVERVADSLSVDGMAGDGSSPFRGGIVVWNGVPRVPAVVALSEAGDTLVRLDATGFR